MQLHAACVLRLVAAILGHAHIAGCHTLDRTVAVVEHLCGSKARIDFHTQRFCLAGQPATDIAEADDEVAMIVHQGRQQEIGNTVALVFFQYQEAVFGNRHIERSAPLLPIREQFIHGDRINHRAREDMSTDFRALLQHADADIRAFSAASCLRRIAALRPEGPAPTITTSYSMNSRSTGCDLAIVIGLALGRCTPTLPGAAGRRISE